MAADWAVAEVVDKPTAEAADKAVAGTEEQGLCTAEAAVVPSLVQLEE